jgi:hypothetical protein
MAILDRCAVPPATLECLSHEAVRCACPHCLHERRKRIHRLPPAVTKPDATAITTIGATAAHAPDPTPAAVVLSSTTTPERALVSLHYLPVRGQLGWDRDDRPCF